MRRVALLSLVLISGVACSASKDPPSEGAIAAIASESLAVRAPEPVAAPAVPQEPEKPVTLRPKDQTDLIVSAERRARVEHFAPEAKGFLTSADLETKLYRQQLKRGKDEDAVKAFDHLAKGRWVLFTGNIGAINSDSFELPIRYTPKDANDPLGLTSVWIPIQLSNVKGYDPGTYQPGELVVMLAKYEGKQKATPGYDVVMLKAWFE